MNKNTEMQLRMLGHKGKFETREVNGELFISGYFAVFNSNYEFAKDMSESIDSHAFDETINDDIRALINHDTTYVLGRKMCIRDRKMYNHDSPDVTMEYIMWNSNDTEKAREEFYIGVENKPKKRKNKA